MPLKDFVVVADDGFKGKQSIFHDKWEEYDGKKTEEYFDVAYTIFLEQLNEFRYSSKRLNKKEAKELTFMLEVLINVKNTLHGK